MFISTRGEGKAANFKETNKPTGAHIFEGYRLIFLKSASSNWAPIAIIVLSSDDPCSVYHKSHHEFERAFIQSWAAKWRLVSIKATNISRSRSPYHHSSLITVDHVFEYATRPKYTSSPRVPPLRSQTELTEPLNSQQPGASLGAYETRQRAILFSGVQAQFISSTSTDNSNAAARATNAVLFGGLILSVCSALLATRVLSPVSGRWFSILREMIGIPIEPLARSRVQTGRCTHPRVSQVSRDAWLSKLPIHLQQSYSQPLSPDGAKSERGSLWRSAMTSSPVQELNDMEGGVLGQKHAPTSKMAPNPRERDVQFVIMIDEEMSKDTTLREVIVSKILLCSVGICCAAFALFAVGIMLLVWNTQP
ncbi:hypothetical protein RHS01_06317 [Rhizoctonia solani]|uniref:Uncharacterized protein n=1 Tax=Rhizoctonia solani TaxID=456999 RepID=A0A8H7I973_9AGAM|nr:hypothetical protein RHS01_06317 [Rhizoctonia solani]